MVEFHQKDIFINGLKLHTETFGNCSNPACLLISGKQATARFWTDVFCNYVANQGFFVIRYDHRDVGQSSEIDWQKAPYTMEDMARDATFVLDGYGIKKAHFIGNSLGGWLCQWIGVSHAERVLSLVIISAAPIEITDKTAIPLSRAEQEMMDATSNRFINRKNGKTLEENVKSFLPIWSYCNGKFLLDEEIAKDFTLDFITRTKNKNAGQNHELMLSAFLATMKRTNTLEKISTPTLVIHGDEDTVIPFRFGKAIAAAIPNSKFIMIPGMGHSFFNRDLEERIAKLVVEHIKYERIT